MIEVALAMAVIAFGMTSILGLFPVGLNACRNAIAENYSTDAVEQFASYLKGYAESSSANFEKLFGSSGFYSETKPVATSAACTDAVNDFLNGISRGKDHSGAAYTPVPVITGWTVYAAKNTGLKDVYFVVFGPGNYMNPSGAAFPTTDFAGMISVWKSQLSYYRPNDANPPDNWMLVTDTAYATGAVLNVEVSWPLDVEDHNMRQKRTFYIEITKPRQ